MTQMWGFRYEECIRSVSVSLVSDAGENFFRIY